MKIHFSAKRTHSSSLARPEGRAASFYRRRGKRALDLAASIVALVVLLPALLFLAIMVRLKLGAPVLFRQARPGLEGKPFTLYKFRTMTDARDAAGRLLPDAERLTSLGRFLRSTSLDELPELFNVLCGDMSLVGPRPLLMQYLDRYTPEQARRHAVRPGLTGWAQVNGRNALTWEQKFAYDLWYVDHMSLWLDLKIIGLTVWKILAREGINQAGQATMDEFQGSQPSCKVS
jgi:sugar transferase EpsL